VHTEKFLRIGPVPGHQPLRGILYCTTVYLRSVAYLPHDRELCSAALKLTFLSFSDVRRMCYVMLADCGPDWCLGLYCHYGRAYDDNGCPLCDCSRPCEVSLMSSSFDIVSNIRIITAIARMRVIGWKHARGSLKMVNVAHTRLPSEGFRSLSRFLAVSLQVTWVTNPAVGCHYFPPGLQLPPQPLRGLLPVSLLGERWVWTVCLRLLPDSVAAAIWTRALLHLSPAR